MQLINVPAAVLGVVDMIKSCKIVQTRRKLLVGCKARSIPALFGSAAEPKYIISQALYCTCTALLHYLILHACRNMHNRPAQKLPSNFSAVYHAVIPHRMCPTILKESKRDMLILYSRCFAVHSYLVCNTCLLPLGIIERTDVVVDRSMKLGSH
ncbi:hypothetical protein EJ05DRAFT_126906 [Pseudovirgaria hyperparasitica]|uniref:Uncharacterized protein n=1 Tax=Pseudovirgaria hyperparasitica TaxID=470096 RepID=A0A6A6VX24_9PEZI|nr:uncharacterized protein EJ05DRAFT_126906 [Pseudovirgaria hyperparasitica]KAF2755228.1 hypothetical protein EJ05DRAFT_126906 [Pseudovirgaria hyperparasitica]